MSESRKKVPQIMQMEAVECGAASLAMILAYYGRWVPLDKLREDCGVGRDGTSTEGVLAAAREYGLEAKNLSLSIDDLKKEKPFPCIIRWNLHHFVVLTGIRGKYVYINDPGKGSVRYPIQAFERYFKGATMTFSTTERFEKGGTKPSSLRFVLKRMQGLKSGIAVVLATSALASVATVLFTTSGKAVVDYYITGKETSSPIGFVLALLGLCVVYGVMQIIRSIYMVRLQGRSAVVDSSRFIQHLLHLPISYFSGRSVGDLQMRQRENEMVVSTLMTQIAPAAINILMLVLYLIVMSYYSVFLTLIGVSTVIVNILVARLVSRKRVDITRMMTIGYGKLNSTALGGIDMIETLKSAGAENSYFKRWAGIHTNVTNADVKMCWLNETMGLIPSLITEITNIVVFALGVKLIIDGKFTPGTLLAFTGLLTAFTKPVNEMITMGQTIQEMQVQMERVEDVLNNPVDVEENTKVLTDEEWEDISKLKGNIEFQNITFGYSARSKPLIENMSLHISAGDKIALVGASGSGKSTLGKLLSGLYKPWSGEILIDGKKLSDIPKQQLKGSLSIVDQDIMVFDDPVGESIRLWDSTIEESEVIRACQDARIHDEIASRKGGYSAVLQPGGRNYSGGQLQRMEIARALAIEPTILVLDEATSALDAETEDEVMNNIRKRGITTVVVAHRLSTIRDADRIYVLDAGTIVEEGTHEELMKLNGV
ncbi:MAG: ATP-binding cassette domain-containing protein, partial [Eubacterium sp.]|nr:ATP-binding cassette domain-containing protein [Eubacterium sp.]